MKTFKLNGFEIEWCCDDFINDLMDGTIWNHGTSFYTMYKGSQDEVHDCPHCEREVRVR